MSRKIRVAVFGDLLYDCFVWADRLPRVGETVTGFKNGFYPGGKGGNQAIAVSRLGADAVMLGKVGSDAHGEFLRSSLKENRVDDTGVLTDPRIPTGTCCVHIDREGNNAIVVVPLANDEISSGDTQVMQPFIGGSNIFLCQLQPNIDAVERCMEFARHAGITTVLNPAPAKPGSEKLFALADYVTPNVTEAEFFSKIKRGKQPIIDWCRQAAARIHELGALRVVITLGEEGAYYSGEVEIFCPPFSVNAVDSTAAGDAFNAGFAISIANGSSIRDAMLFANASGAITASRHGSQPSLPFRAEVDLLVVSDGAPVPVCPTQSDHEGGIH